MFTTLTRKVLLIGLIGLGLFMAVAVVAIANVLNIRAAANHTAAVTLAQVQLSDQFNTDMFRGLAEALAFARTPNQTYRASALQEMHDAGDLLEELDPLERTPDPNAPELALAHQQLQEKRTAIYAAFAPAINGLVRAMDSQDAPATTAALDMLNQHKSSIEQLEEETGVLSERSIVAANDTIAAATRFALISLGISFGLFILLLIVALLLLRRFMVRPILDLARAAQAVASGQLDQSVAITTNDELGSLQRAFNGMARSLAAAQATVAEQQRTLEARVAERTADLTQALADLRESTSVQAQLNATVRALASPVMPVLEGILVMPLIGTIDSARATLLLQTLLSAIEQYRARVVLIDVTGVPIIDTQVAQVLLQAALTSKLLGTQAMLVGLRPELAQTIVGLGLDLSSLLTHADLQSGVRYAMRYQHA